MSSLFDLLKAGGRASALREQERQLRNMADTKIKLLQDALRGDAGSELILHMHKVPQQDHAHGRLSLAWVAIQQAKGVVGALAQSQFNKQVRCTISQPASSRSLPGH